MTAAPFHQFAVVPQALTWFANTANDTAQACAKALGISAADINEMEGLLSIGWETSPGKRYAIEQVRRAIGCGLNAARSFSQLALPLRARRNAEQGAKRRRKVRA